MLIEADSGILLRLINRADAQHARVRASARILKQRGDVLVTTAQNLAEFWNVCARPVTARGGFGLSLAETQRRLRLLERRVRILPDSSASFPIWRQLVVAQAVMGVQVHDARLMTLMMTHGVTHLFTLNPGDFNRYPSITVLTPSDLLAAQTPSQENTP
jgi:predicted nucleic acid-binding protein